MKRLITGAPRRQDAIARIVTRSSIWLAAASGLMSIFLFGCPGTLDAGVGPGPGGATGGTTGSSNCQVAIFASTCAIAGCHASGSPAAGLDLQAANPEMRLVGQMTGDAASGSMCSGHILLDPTSNPATGVFIDKITNMTPTCGGAPMPYGTLLPAMQMACLTAWATSVTSTAAFTGGSP